MGTRSRIGVMHGDKLKSVYCHWDGYLDNNGVLLRDNYTDPFKVQRMMDLGDMSSLRKDIGEKHAFSHFDLPVSEIEAFEKLTENMCTFYGRDRGEEGTQRKRFADFSDYKKEHQYEEYEYILRTDGKWYVSDHGGDYKLLVIELAEEALV